jgi:acyl-CoA thioester hydrolase
MPKPKLIESRDRYRLFDIVTTRWMDNDVYGHVNNTVYNAWMDTAIEVPVAGETQMTFHQSIAHPASVETGFRVERIGTSSVRCGVGIFLAESKEASAWGHMVHVWVDKQTNRSVAIPASVREGLESALAPAEN